MSFKFGQIQSRNTELAALEPLIIDVATFSRLLFISFAIYPILFNFLGIEDMHNI